MDVLRSGYSTSVACLATHSHNHALTPPQLITGPFVSLFRCQSCCVTKKFLDRCYTHVDSPQIGSPQHTKVQVPPESNLENQ